MARASVTSDIGSEIADQVSLTISHDSDNDNTQLGKGAEKKTRKKFGLLPNRGGGSRRVVKSQTSILEKYFFQ